MIFRSRKPLIIQYANLLHRYKDVGHRKVVGFIARMAGDEAFVRRAKVSNGLYDRFITQIRIEASYETVDHDIAEGLKDVE